MKARLGRTGLFARQEDDSRDCSSTHCQWTGAMRMKLSNATRLQILICASSPDRTLSYSGALSWRDRLQTSEPPPATIQMRQAFKIGLPWDMPVQHNVTKPTRISARTQAHAHQLLSVSRVTAAGNRYMWKHALHAGYGTAVPHPAVHTFTSIHFHSHTAHSAAAHNMPLDPFIRTPSASCCPLVSQGSAVTHCNTGCARVVQTSRIRRHV